MYRDWLIRILFHGPITRSVKLWFAHAPGMPGTFSPAADFKGNRWLAIPACIMSRASHTCRDACRDRFSAVVGKTFPAFPQFYVFGHRPMHLSVFMHKRYIGHRIIFVFIKKVWTSSWLHFIAWTTISCLFIVNFWKVKKRLSALGWGAGLT